MAPDDQERKFRCWMLNTILRRNKARIRANILSLIKTASKASKFSVTQPSNMGEKLSIISLYSQFCRCRKDWQQVISYSAIEIRFEFSTGLILFKVVTKVKSFITKCWPLQFFHLFNKTCLRTMVSYLNQFEKNYNYLLKMNQYQCLGNCPPTPPLT